MDILRILGRFSTTERSLPPPLGPEPSPERSRHRRCRSRNAGHFDLGWKPTNINKPCETIDLYCWFLVGSRKKKHRFLHLQWQIKGGRPGKAIKKNCIPMSRVAAHCNSFFVGPQVLGQAGQVWTRTSHLWTAWNIWRQFSNWMKWIYVKQPLEKIDACSRISKNIYFQAFNYSICFGVVLYTHMNIYIYIYICIYAYIYMRVCVVGPTIRN